LGILDEYDLMVATESGWLFDKRLRLWRHGKLLNGRSPCPLGCRKRGRPILRRNCCRKPDLVGLIDHEFRRRKHESAFIHELKSANMICCGTLDECCLTKPERTLPSFRRQNV
jgi:hypothetical protein